MYHTTSQCLCGREITEMQSDFLTCAMSRCRSVRRALQQMPIAHEVHKTLVNNMQAEQLYTEDEHKIPFTTSHTGQCYATCMLAALCTVMQQHSTCKGTGDTCEASSTPDCHKSLQGLWGVDPSLGPAEEEPRTSAGGCPAWLT